MIELSLVTATHGRLESLHRLLDSLLLQTVDDFELIIVDQNPKHFLDSIIVRLKDQSFPYQYYRLEEPSQHVARTLGLAKARGNLIGFPDDDCWYDRYTTEGVIKTFRELAPDVVIARWPQRGDKVTECELKWSEIKRFQSGAESMIVQFYRTSLVREVGGFSSEFGIGTWYGGAEDTDLLFSVAKLGCKIVSMPDVVVHHPVASDDGARGDLSSLRIRARGTGAIYAKHKLSAFVVIRGLLGPILQPILTAQLGSHIRRGWQLSMGRAEGYLKWLRKE